MPEPVAVVQREGWELHWQRVRERVDLRAAALCFLLVVALALAGLGFGATRIERFYYAMNIAVNHRDVRQLNLQDDQLLQAYLRTKPTPGVNECVLVGASLTATAHDQDPAQRLQGRLQSKLARQTGERWLCTNVATDSAVTWTYFYNARLLRLYRPPKVLVVGIDINFPRDRNSQLVLNLGVRDHDLSPAELSYAVPYNRQLLYVSEANAQRWLRDASGAFRALHFAAFSTPTRRDVAQWLRFLAGQATGAPAPSLSAASNPAGANAPKSWREVPGNKARIEYYQANGGVPQPWDARMAAEYDLLFAELERCQEAGIKVIVVSMPRNPAVKHLIQPMQECVTQAAAKHHVAFHDYWLSGKIPDQYFLDFGHYFGPGTAVMADEIARLITAEPAQAGTGGRQ
jgi:hypothetical protein